MSPKEETERQRQKELEEYRASFPLQIKLLDHQHTLFCERKQRVCLAVGKVQELEKIRVLSVPSSSSSSVVWTRSKVNDEKGAYEAIESTRGQMEYTFCTDDVGCYISVECAGGGPSSSTLTSAPIGPVLAGPARLLDVKIEAEKNQIVEGTNCFLPGAKLRAVTHYIGGTSFFSL